MIIHQSYSKRMPLGLFHCVVIYSGKKCLTEQSKCQFESCGSGCGQKSGDPRDFFYAEASIKHLKIAGELDEAPPRLR
ncbi:hypothetical protein JOB18_010206 [Solea senegalensis]|uniref:Uncharacterized protein n=1 Tax=Solea senegalensis TaxID=28829 RepID=A0AAV6S6Z1_SOLSE|nr:hypothetical protein JOB18_010206 [Solea senegalensis]